MSETRTLTPDQARREDVALVERVTGQRLTRITGPCLERPDLMGQALVYRPSPQLEVKAVEFFQAERAGDPERLLVEGAAFRALVDVCRHLDAARKRIGELVMEDREDAAAAETALREPDGRAWGEPA